MNAGLPAEPRSEIARGESFIRALSWGWLTYGGLCLVSGTFVFLVMALKASARQSSISPVEQWMSKELAGYQLGLLGATALLGAVTILATMGLIRHRRWGRSLLEGSCYAHIVVLIVGTLFHVQFIQRVDLFFESEFSKLITLFLIIGQAGTSVGFITVVIISIVGLRSAKVRAALDARNLPVLR